MSEAPKVIWATEQAGGDTRRFGIWDNIEEDVVAGSEKYHHDDTVTALQAKVADLEAALDSKHAEVGSNIWRFWRDQAQECAKALKEATDGA